MAGCGMTCVKYMLFAFNLIFFFFGLGLIISGAVIEAHFKEYFDVIGSRFSTAAALLIVVGCIILIIGFFGCCGAVKENHCMVMTFAVLLSVIIIMEIAAAIMAFKMKAKVKDTVKKGLTKSMKKYPTAKATQKAWDAMQAKLKCCGVDNGPSDWKNKTTPLAYPKSCCKDTSAANCGKTVDLAYQKGCVDRLTDLLKSEIAWIGGIGLVVALVEIVGIIFACCLARSIKQGYQSV